MDKIKIAEETIKTLKDYIEIERTIKKSLTEKAKYELKTLSATMLNIAENDIKELKEIK